MLITASIAGVQVIFITFCGAFFEVRKIIHAHLTLIFRASDSPVKRHSMALLPLRWSANDSLRSVFATDRVVMLLTCAQFRAGSLLRLLPIDNLPSTVPSAPLLTLTELAALRRGSRMRSTLPRPVMSG